ncbi:MAG: YdcF family protein [Clostridia bacterium]|nr:YdcF family protein [Clostridia bacterium]
MKWKKIKRVLFFIMSVLCLLYFFVCMAYSGLWLSWIWVWLLAGGFCALRFLMLNREIKGVWKHKPPKWFCVIYRIVLVMMTVTFLFVEGQIISGMTTKPESGLSYVIVLGAGVRGTTPTRPLLLRMQCAYEYLSANPETIAIASGGQGADEDISEAQCIRDYLVNQGIDAKRILMEDQSTSTEENLRNSFELIPQDAETVGILTNGFHIYRSLLIAGELGHENVSGVPARTLFPVGIHYVVREFFAVMKLKLVPVR